MAIVSQFLSNKMVTSLNYGMVDGKEVIKKKSYGNVRQDVSIEAIHNIATVIGGLQTPSLETVDRVLEDLIYDDGL